jgi:hypothetical protein
MCKFITKLGTNKGLPKSRVWIEGKRLSDHGFNRGTRYDRVLKDGQIMLSENENGAFKVSGKADHPIIDITGKAITDTFPNCDNVIVHYTVGVIFINGESK